MRLRLWFCLLCFLPACRAFSSVALLPEEPFGAFGSVNPTGHAAIYLSHVCAESPVELRSCGPGEPGVVISRYYKIGGYDWLAIPLIPYLYAVDRLDQVPQTASPQQEEELRDAWRRRHLEAVAPDTPGGKPPGGDWIQLIGSLYDRKIYVIELETTREQDESFIRDFNQKPNRSHFDLLFHNCADFSRLVLDFYFPHAVRRSYSADAGMTTPKQLAKSLVRYSARHEELDMHEFVLPQVDGSIPRSKHVDGVLEAVIRKKYVLPVAILHPYFAAGLAVTYLTGGRYDPAKGAVPLKEDAVVQTIWLGEPSSPHPGRPLVSSKGVSNSAIAEPSFPDIQPPSATFR